VERGEGREERGEGCSAAASTRCEKQEEERGRGGDSETGRRGDRNMSASTTLCSQSLSPSPPLPISSSSSSRLQIEFISYAKAYGEDFEDCRCRVPCLEKLRKLVGLSARYRLDDIIRELVEWKKRQLAAGC
jgi:hypothetical protein